MITDPLGTSGPALGKIPASSSFARLRRMCAKELRESLRDRRTLVTLILMPLIVYPTLALVFQRFLLSNQLTRANPEMLIAVPDDTSMETLAKVLTIGERYLRERMSSPAELETVSALKEIPGTRSARLVIPEGDPRDAVRDKLVDLALIPLPSSADRRSPARGQSTAPALVPETEQSLPSPDREVGLRFLCVRSLDSLASQQALRYVTERLNAFHFAMLETRLTQLGKPAEPPIAIEVESVGEASGTVLSLATLIPLVLILMTMTGSVYPAIDTTAGERERGTLEALIATPVPRFALLLAKYVAVVAVSMLTALANLIAMTLTLYSTGLSGLVLGAEGLSFGMLAQSFGLLVLFAFFFSAVVLAVTSFARSFKEAQAYLIPLILMCLGPSLISLTPGLELTPGLAVTPLFNIVLLARDIFHREPFSSLSFVVLVSSLFYSLAAVALAARVFGSDAVLYGSEHSWSEMWQRPRAESNTVSSGTAVLTLAFLTPSFILLATWISRVHATHLPTFLAVSAVVTALVFGAIPFLISRHQRARFETTFLVRSASPQSIVGAILIGATAWILVLTVTYPFQPVTFGSDEIAFGREFVARLRALPLPLVLLAMAIVPAIFEEFFFRGFLLSSFLRESTPTKTILVSAFVFGIFHVMSGSLAAGRFLPSTLIGLLLGWVCYRSGSLIPPMILHAFHNAILLTLSYQYPKLEAAGWDKPSPLALMAAVIVALLCCGLGVLLVATRGRRDDGIKPS